LGRTGDVDIDNRQRALWTVLLIALIAPFFAAVIGIVLALLVPALGVPAPYFAGTAAPLVGPQAFLWAAMPALVAAVALLPFVLQSGTFPWLYAAVAGVVGFGAGAIITPFEAGALRPLLAGIAGLILVAVRSLLISRRILLP
jgi:hypothetical protein